MPTRAVALSAAVFALLLAGCAGVGSGSEAGAPWRPLFDGQGLGGFAVTDFGGQGEVAVREGALVLGIGSPLTGVTWTGEAPVGSYELEVVAARLQGGDFFCGLTFPVGQDHLTLVLGGWGGSLCGFSSLDGNDAAHNDSRCMRGFTDGQDYTVRVTVTPEQVTATLDGQPLCAIDPRKHALSLRPEVRLSRPLGLASFATEAAIRRACWRPVGG